jgi:hypothetical protein
MTGRIAPGQGKNVAARRCGKAIEAKPSIGQDSREERPCRVWRPRRK